MNMFVTLPSGITINLMNVIKFLPQEDCVEVITNGFNCGEYISHEDYQKIIEKFSVKL